MKSRVSTQPRAKFQLQKPWLLWICSAVSIVWGMSAFVWLIIANPLAEIMQPVQALVFATLASLLIFERTKGAWTISIMGWLSALGLTFLSWQTLQDLSQHSILLELSCGLLTLNLILALLYLKHPYVDSRSSLLGRSVRRDCALDAQVSVEDPDAQKQIWSTKAVSVSPSGFRMEMPKESKLSIGDRILVQISEISGFKSSAVVVDSSGEFIAVELLGWSLPSLKEHLKLRKWLRKKSSTNQAGYSLVETMAVAVLSSVVVMALSQLVLDMYSIENRAKGDYSIQLLKYEIFTAIQDSASWKVIVANPDNLSMLCLRQKTGCSPVTNPGGFIKVVSSQNELIFDSTNPRQGFTKNGMLCKEYDSVNGNDACPYRFEVSWRPVCSDNCLNPATQIDIKLVIKQNRMKDVVNVDRRTMSFVRDAIADTLQANCEGSLRGTYDPDKETCLWKRVDSDCAAKNQLLVGFKQDGSAVCEPFQMQSCPLGSWLNGFDTDGKVICQSS